MLNGMLRIGDILGVCLKIGLNFPMQMFTRRKRREIDDELPKKIGEKTSDAAEFQLRGRTNFKVERS